MSSFAGVVLKGLRALGALNFELQGDSPTRDPHVNTKLLRWGPAVLWVPSGMPQGVRGLCAFYVRYALPCAFFALICVGPSYVLLMRFI